jgi:hypothetical protein
MSDENKVKRSITLDKDIDKLLEERAVLFRTNPSALINETLAERFGLIKLINPNRKEVV